MPERIKPEPAYDPADWSNADPAQGGEDPLVELARIVSGRTSFDTGSRYEPAPRYEPSPRYEPAPRNEIPRNDRAASAAPEVSESDLASDLEAELMRDLQASFAAVRAPFDASAGETADSAYDALDHELPGEPAGAHDEADFDAFADMHLRQSVPTEPIRPAPPKAGIESLASWRETLGRSKAKAVAPAVRSSAESNSQSPGRGNLASSFGENDRFGARGGAIDALAGEPELAAAAAAAESFGLPVVERVSPTAFESIGRASSGEYAPVPGYEIDQGQDPDEPDYQSVRRQRPARSGRRSVAIVGALLVILALGAGAVAYRGIGPAEHGTPPVIAADKAPTKVAPADPGGTDSPAPSKLIYDRVGATDEAAQSTLAPSGDETVTTVPRPASQATDASREISRIILPNSGDPQLPPGEPAAAGPAATESPAADGEAPKRVRTVVVRPDGTIVSNSSAPATAPRTAEAPTAKAPPVAAENAAPPPAATMALTDTAPPPVEHPAKTQHAPPPTVDTTTTATARTTGDTGTAEALAGSDDLAPADDEALAAEPDPVAAAPVVKPKPVKPAKPAASDGPISLLPKPEASPPKPAPVKVASVEPDAPAASANSGGGGLVVQLTSQKSQSAALAAYRDLQRRFPSLLANREPDIKKADLGSRGTFYRVRVSSENANSLCTSLKEAGADCIVTR